jgi:hypothetical protein
VRRDDSPTADGIEMVVELPASRADALRDFVRDLTRGRGEVDDAP